MTPDEIKRNLERIRGNPAITGGTQEATVQLVMHSFEQLSETLDRHAASNDRLGKKVCWLNIVLTSATVVLACVACFELLYKIFYGVG